VTWINTHVTETGNVQHAVDLAQRDIMALVYDEATSRFATHPPTKTGDGTFEFPDLAQGQRYYLRINRVGVPPVYVVTSATNLDLGSFVMGRPDTATAGTGTSLVFDVDNLAPWQQTDALQLYSAGAGAVAQGIESSASTGVPSSGATSVSNLTIDYVAAANTPNLIDGAKGDRAWFTQLVTRTLGSETYLSLGRALELAAFSQTSGQSLRLAGSLTEATQQTLGVDFKISQFEGIWRPSNPSAELVMNHINMVAQLESPHGWTGVTPDVIYYVTQSSGDLVASFSYGNPFPASYGLILQGLSRFRRSYTMGAATGNATGDISFMMAPTASSTLAPVLGTVQAPTIAGRDAITDQSGVGLSPELHWSPPSLGTPSLYRLVFIRAVADAATLGGALAGVVYTTNTDIVVPPGILSPGETYVIRFSAISRGFDGAQQPFLVGLPDSSSDVLSGLISP
jgi:hypothetical protein